MKPLIRKLIGSSTFLLSAVLSMTLMAAQKDILIDFGSSSANSPAYNAATNTEGWNNINSGAAGTTIADLKDTTGTSTGIGITINDSFWGTNDSNLNGTKSSTIYPATATQDSFFIGTLSGILDSSAGLHVSGLQSNKQYSMKLYASRMTSDLTSDRTTLYTINGVSKELQVRNNVDGYVEFNNLSAVNGAIDIGISMKAGAVFGYLGVLEIVENSLPTANAGSDKTITLPTSSVTLSGSGTDSDGTISKYAWTKVSGGAATISSPASASTSITGLAQGSYTFRLTVTDNDGATASDDVVVNVNQAPNVAPTANAGADKTITLPTASVTFSGSGTDSDGTISKYAWTKVSGGTATITSPAAASTSVTGLAQGNYTFRLTVTDNAGATAFDDVNVTVNAAVNIAPTANAGADKTITLPTSSVTLSGAGTDSDGSITKYSWTKVSGGTATIGSPSSATTSINSLGQGTYTFRLTVTDNAGATDTDDVIVTVKAANAVPVANAGSDKLITLPTNSITLSGSGSDTDGTISKYAWSKVSGGTATITSPSNPSTTVTGLAQGSYTFRLTVTDNAGATDTDDVNLTVNAAPVANAGSDITITLPTNYVTLKGTATDADGTIASYSWTKITSNAATINSPSSASTTVTNLVQGTYTFRLTVKDNRGAVDTDDVNVTVNAQTTTLSAPKETLIAYTTAKADGGNYGYSIYLPEGYTQKSSWPVIMFLHGLGETNKVNSSGVDCNLSAVGKWGPLKYTRAGYKIPAIVIAPQSRTDYWSVDGIEAFRKYVVAKYSKMDTNKFYLTGLSMGGGGTCAYANKYGQTLAAAMPLSPAGTLNTTGAQKLLTNHAGFWGYHCTDDGIVGKEHTINSINNIGIDLGEASAFTGPTFPKTTTLLVKTTHYDPSTKKWVFVDAQASVSGVPQMFATFYNHGGHGGWQRMYEDPKVYSWLVQQYIH